MPPLEDMYPTCTLKCSPATTPCASIELSLASLLGCPSYFGSRTNRSDVGFVHTNPNHHAKYLLVREKRMREIVKKYHFSRSLCVACFFCKQATQTHLSRWNLSVRKCVVEKSVFAQPWPQIRDTRSFFGKRKHSLRDSHCLGP